MKRWTVDLLVSVIGYLGGFLLDSSLMSRKEVMLMSDYEMLMIVIAILGLVIAVYQSKK